MNRPDTSRVDTWLERVRQTRRRGLAEELISGYLALAALHRALAAECSDAASAAHQHQYARAIDGIGAAVREELQRIEHRSH